MKLFYIKAVITAFVILCNTCKLPAMDGPPSYEELLRGLNHASGQMDYYMRELLKRQTTNRNMLSRMYPHTTRGIPSLHFTMEELLKKTESIRGQMGSLEATLREQNRVTQEWQRTTLRHLALSQREKRHVSTQTTLNSSPLRRRTVRGRIPRMYPSSADYAAAAQQKFRSTAPADTQSTASTCATFHHPEQAPSSLYQATRNTREFSPSPISSSSRPSSDSSPPSPTSNQRSTQFCNTALKSSTSSSPPQTYKASCSLRAEVALGETGTARFFVRPPHRPNEKLYLPSSYDADKGAYKVEYATGYSWIALDSLIDGSHEQEQTAYF